MIKIRNCTNIPIHLKLVEHIEPLLSGASFPSSFACIGGNVSKASTLLRTALGLKSLPAGLTTPLSKHDFESSDTPIDPFAQIQLDNLTHPDIASTRLVFEIQHERYYIDISSNIPLSTTLTPLNPPTSHSFICIYHSTPQHLTILPNIPLSTWMSTLPDSTPLPALSIPGTHNTTTCYRALPGVRCQAVHPVTQIHHGIRYLDIRLSPSQPIHPTHDTIQLVHGLFPISLSGPKHFRPLVNHLIHFLTTHPSETIILSLKLEGRNSGPEAQHHLSILLRNFYIADPERWYTDPRIPSLGEVRGKLVLLRRFALDESLKLAHEGRGWGLDARAWRYNCPWAEHGAVCVQDFCKIVGEPHIERKVKVVKEHFVRASVAAGEEKETVGEKKLFLNFLSGNNLWNRGSWPERVAARLNPEALEYLCTRHPKDEKGSWTTGVVVCDWVGEGGDWDLVRCIVGMNSRLLEPMSGSLEKGFEGEEKEKDDAGSP